MPTNESIPVLCGRVQNVHNLSKNGAKHLLMPTRHQFSLTKSSGGPHEAGIIVIVIPILQRRRLRQRKAK